MTEDMEAEEADMVSTRCFRVVGRLGKDVSVEDFLGVRPFV